MYYFKEKSKLLRELAHPSHAASDLILLKRLAPGHDLLKSRIPDPGRFAERILFALLDLSTAEDIRANRRSKEKKVNDKKERSNEGSSKKTKSSPSPKASRQGTEGEEQGGRNSGEPLSGTDHSAEEPGKDDVNSSLKEAGEEPEETKGEPEDVRGEVQETKGEPEESGEEVEEKKSPLKGAE